MFINQIKTIALLGGIAAMLIFAGKWFGGTQGALMMLVVAATINAFAYFFSASMVLAAYGAKPLDQNRHANIYSMVSELSAQARLPMPKLYFIDHSMANAFATGRNPQNSAIAVTAGILSLLEEDELRGVLAHEMSHIKNRDVLIATIAATFAMAISYLASMLRWQMFWGGSGGKDDNRRGWGALLAAIVMPIAATLVQLAISRAREFEADATGAEISQSPLALASALQKLDASAERTPFRDATYAQQAATSLFICNPFSLRTLANLFSTHPNTKERVKRLEKMVRMQR